jgi:hypothetical protein
MAVQRLTAKLATMNVTTIDKLRSAAKSKKDVSQISAAAASMPDFFLM